MSMLRLVFLAIALLTGQHEAATHGFSHLALQGEAGPMTWMQSSDGSPLDTESDFCAVCTAFSGSHGAPPLVGRSDFPSVPDVPVRLFAVAPAPTFLLTRAFEPRAPPTLPV